jgi:hypothetical protein
MFSKSVNIFVLCGLEIYRSKIRRGFVYDICDGL